MANIAELAVQLTARTGKFVKGMRKSASSVTRFAKTVGRATLRAAKFSAVLAGVAVGALALMVRQQFKAIDATSKLADTLGLTTKQLVGYQLAAKISGVEVGQLNTGLRRLQKNISDATLGLTTAIRAFDSLGISAEKLIKLSPDEQLKAIADELKNIPNQADRVRVALDLFGRSGLGFIKLFEKGGKGLSEMQREAELLGISFSRVDGAQIELANDALARASLASTGLALQIAKKLAPVVKLVADRFTKWSTEGVGAAVRVEQAVIVLVDVAGKLADAWLLVKKNVLLFKAAALQATSDVLLSTKKNILALESMANFLSQKLAKTLPKSSILVAAAASSLSGTGSGNAGIAAELAKEAAAAVAAADKITFGTAEKLKPRIEEFFDNARKAAEDSLSADGQNIIDRMFGTPSKLDALNAKAKKLINTLKGPAGTGKREFAATVDLQALSNKAQARSLFSQSKQLQRQSFIQGRDLRAIEVSGLNTPRSEGFRAFEDIAKEQLQELKEIANKIGMALIPRFT